MRELFSVFLQWARALKPPPADDAHAQRHWQKAIAWSVWILGLYVLLHTIMINGWWPSLFDGYVRQSQFKSLESEVQGVRPMVKNEIDPIDQKVTQILLYQLGDKMHDEQHEYCATKDDDAGDMISQQISHQQQMYFQLAGTYFQLQGCSK